MKQQNNDMKQCQAYFKSRSVFAKLFEKMQKKYAGLGHFGGRIVLSGLNTEEKAQLGGFVQKDYTENKTVTISMELLQKALNNSRFSKFTWKEILENYYKKTLVTKKEAERDKLLRKQSYFDEIVQSYAGERGKEWIRCLLKEKGLGYQILRQQYGLDEDTLRETLHFLFSAIEKLPVFEKKTNRLPVFAADITGNPHFFDYGTTGGKLLLHFICDYFGNEKIGETWPEKRSSLFYQAGILTDDLSNNVLVYGIHGEEKEGGLHDGMEGYYRIKEPLQLTLLTLRKLKRAWGNANIYAVENPAVFSMLTESNPTISAVCTNGQLRLSALMLLDLLSKNSVLYYAGDFDPEGLSIAQKLKVRYGKKLCLWNYKKEYYEKTVSGVVLSEERLKKLEKIHLEELQEIKKAIQSEGKAGYQENMVWNIKRNTQ